MVDQKWMETCINAGELLYGEFPMEVFHKLYETKCPKTTTEEVMEYYDESLMMLCDGERFTPLLATKDPLLSVFKEADAAGNPFASIHFDLGELQQLRKETQIVADVDYWIPSTKQIEQLANNQFLSSPAFKALESEVLRLGGDPLCLKTIWGRLCTDKVDGFEIVQEVLDGVEIGFKSEADVHRLLPYIMDFTNSVNLRSRKGWPPSELSKHGPKHNGVPTIVPGSAHAAQMMRQTEPQLRAMGANVDYSSIDSFATIGAYGERRVLKVGRNDPCPCGSGKKYKQCHGRNM